MTQDNIRWELEQLYKANFNEKAKIINIKGGGSAREYFRLKGENGSVIGVYSDDIKENTDFIKMQSCLKKNNIKVPEIYAVSINKRFYLIEDLGDNLLLDLLTSQNKLHLAEEALKILLRIQTIPKEEWVNSVGYKPFSERLVNWDLNYFKYDFLKPSQIQFDEEKLEDDFGTLRKELLGPDVVKGLMYRDFQSRNIMVKDGDFYFIDFQGAREGPIVYDAVSFIWQAKAPFSYEEREKLSNFYISQLALQMLNQEPLYHQMYDMQVFRTLQVLGAYGFRGLIEKKSHFIESIPFAVKNLSYLREKGRLEAYPEIKRISYLLENKYSPKGHCQTEGLTLTVMSFSYKKGYPEDKTGNGGGFVFDCRALHNPGRYIEYKQLTGRDKEVIEFLDKTGDAEKFVNKAVEIVGPSIEKYIRRGFTSLQVSFGCTGGQHRSVYCADRFGEKIINRYPRIKCKVIHREQNY